jgi:hypothetical protein
LQGVLCKKTFRFDRQTKRRYFTLDPQRGVMEYYGSRADYLLAARLGQERGGGAGDGRRQPGGAKSSAKRIIDLAQCTKLQWSDPATQLEIDLLLARGERIQLSSANFGPGPFESPAAAKNQMARWFSSIAVCTASALQRRALRARVASPAPPSPPLQEGGASSAAGVADRGGAAAPTIDSFGSAAVGDLGATAAALREAEAVLELACALLQGRLEASVMEASQYSIFDRKLQQLQRQVRLPPMEIVVRVHLTARMLECDGSELSTAAAAPTAARTIGRGQGAGRPGRAESRASYDDDALTSLVFGHGSLFDGRLVAAAADGGAARSAPQHRRSRSMPTTLPGDSIVAALAAADGDVRAGGERERERSRRGSTNAPQLLARRIDRRAFGSLDVGPFVVRGGAFGDGSLAFEAQLMHATVCDEDSVAAAAVAPTAAAASGSFAATCGASGNDALRPAVPLAEQLLRQRRQNLAHEEELRKQKQLQLTERGEWANAAAAEKLRWPATMAAHEMRARGAAATADGAAPRWWQIAEEDAALCAALAARAERLAALRRTSGSSAGDSLSNALLRSFVDSPRGEAGVAASSDAPRRGAAIVSASASMEEVGWRNVIRMFRMHIAPLEVQLTERWVRKLYDFCNVKTLGGADSCVASTLRPGAFASLS